MIQFDLYNPNQQEKFNRYEKNDVEFTFTSNIGIVLLYMENDSLEHMTFENIKGKFIEKLNSLTKMEYYNNMYPYSNLSTQYSIVKREPKYYSTTDTISTRAYRKIVTNISTPQ